MEEDNEITLSEEEEFLFNDVFEAYIDFSAYGLMNKTHGEMPWRTTNTGIGNVISHEKMTEFFWQGAILAVVLFFATKKLKWHPIVFIAISALVGIVFKFEM